MSLHTDVSTPDHYHKVVDCQWACPAHTNVPEYIRLIAQGRYDDSYMLNRESNVFPGILGRTCDRPCEPACRRGRASTASRSPSAASSASPPTSATTSRDRLPKAPHAEERQAGGAHRRRPGLAHRRQRPAAARLRGRRSSRRTRRPGGLMRVNIPSFRLPASRCSTRRSRTSSTWASTCATTRRSRASAPCSIEGVRRGLRGQRRAQGQGTRDSRALGRPDQIHIGIEWLESVHFGHVDSIGEARADHRRRQHRHGLLPHRPSGSAPPTSR